MRTVFHVSSPESFEAVDAEVQTLAADDTVDIEAVAVVVDDADAIDRLATDLADVAEALDEMDAALKVCLDSLREANVGEKALPTTIDVVQSGVGELTRLQHDGYAYIQV